jgi:hypothetical protein
MVLKAGLQIMKTKIDSFIIAEIDDAVSQLYLEAKETLAGFSTFSQKTQQHALPLI